MLATKSVWEDSLYLNSSNVLHPLPFFPYINSKSVLEISTASLTDISLNFDTAFNFSSFFCSVLWAALFPILYIALVVSQPVSECKAVDTNKIVLQVLLRLCVRV